MKIKSLSRRTVITVSYIMVFLCSMSFVQAQCPIVTDPTPTAVCDAAGLTFSELTTYLVSDGSLNENGAIVRYYNTLTGGTPNSTGAIVTEGTYFVDNNNPSIDCSPRQPITIDFVVNDSGVTFANNSYCSNENPTVQDVIDDNIAGSIPPGGSVQIYSDFDLTNVLPPTTPLAVGNVNFYIVFIDNSGCSSQFELGFFSSNESLSDPIPENPQEFCTDVDPNPTIGDLDPGTTDPFQWFDAVDGNGDPIDPNNPLNPSTPLVDGNSYYVWASGSCPSNTVPVVVNIDDPFDPGASGTLDYCEDSIPITDIDLFDALVGLPDNNGTWTGPIATSNGYQGTVNISTLTPNVYIFTYTVPENGACPEDASTVTITIYERFIAGTPSIASPESFCESTLPSAFDLFTLITGGDPNGQWTQGALSTDPVVTSPIDLTSFTPGTYNFTYTQNMLPNSCPEESTTVQVVVLADPNAGTAVNDSFCENVLATNSPYDLFDALDGSQDNNSGSWTDISNNTISNPIDITGFTVAGSPYQYTYIIDNGTCSDSEQITITIDPAPESGEPIDPMPEVCQGDPTAVINLFDLLTGEDTNGTWYEGVDTTTSGTVVGNPTALDLTAVTANTYFYTYSVPNINTCSDDDVTVNITIKPLPNVGTLNSPSPFCENDAALNPIDLFDFLTGEDQSGTWYLGTDNTGATVPDPTMLDVSNNPIGIYNYYYEINGANGCANDATISIEIVDAPSAGTVNVPAPFCLAEITTGQFVSLFDFLVGADQPGVWSDDSSSGQLAGSNVTLDGLAAGTYNFTYDVDAIGTCDDPNMPTVTITINDTAAPTATAEQSFCDAATVANLSAIGTTIQWYEEAIGGMALTSITPLGDGESYYATQTDATTGCESATRVEVIVTINQSPNAGVPAATPIIECNNATVDLNTGLDGSQDTTGTWMDDDSTGAVTGNTFDTNGITPGTYNFTYLVTAAPPCLDDSTTITVTIQEPLSAGTSNGDLPFCSTDATYNLFDNIAGADLGGSWSFNSNTVSNIFDPGVENSSGTYTYTIANTCGTDSVSFNITVTPVANAGTLNAETTSFCVSEIATDQMIDLFIYLDGETQTGTWTDDSMSGQLSGNILTIDNLNPGTYTFTYTVTATAPCTVNDTSQVTITINDTAAAIIVNATPEFCLVDGPTVADLTPFTSGFSITWYAEQSDTTPLNTTDPLEDGEDYFAVQNDPVTGCESSLRVSLTVTVGNAPTPTLLDVNQELCINDAPTINDLTLNVSEYNATSNNVVWYDAVTNGNVVSSATALSPNTTYYVALIDPVTGCESSLRLEVNPDLTSCGILMVPDGFSPNGDGINDTFYVDNLDILYPNFVMEIYNRYGNIVYKGNASSPAFDGKSNQSRTMGSGDLPVGVYYYIFNFNDGVNKPEQGRLYLNR